MNIGSIKVSGPNVEWYVITTLFVLLGGWKGAAIWFGLNLVFVVGGIIHLRLNKKETHP